MKDLGLFLKNHKGYFAVIAILGLGGILLLCVGVQTDKEVWKTIWISIGTSLLAAVIVMVLEIYRVFSGNQILLKTNNLIHGAGIQWVYQKRDLDRYDGLMRQLSTNLDITGYSLGAFFDSYSTMLRQKLNSNGSLKVRIIFVDPASTHSHTRAEIEGKNREQFEDRIRTFRNFFSNVPNVHIKFIKAPLSSMIFRIDDTMFVGPHFYKDQSKATLTMEIKNGHWLYTEYRAEFEEMWNDAESV